MNLQTLRLDVAEHVATVTIQRPEKLNALNAQCKQELSDLAGALASDPTVAVVILTGAGEKAFVAGTDIEELTSLDRASGEAFSRSGQEVFNRIEGMGKPVIAAVNGYALGGGCELALACHLRIASEKARFGQPEVNLGIIPGYAGTQRLARTVGRARAMEMILTGVPVDAQEALRMGLVNRVVPHDQLMSAAREMAAAIVKKGQRAIHFALEAILASDSHPPDEGERIEARLFGECCSTYDFHEGARAFLEKRTPRFENR